MTPERGLPEAASGTPRSKLEAMLAAALRAVNAGDAVRRALRRDASGQLEIAGRPVGDESHLIVLAAGKAAAEMAAAAEAVAADRIRAGLVVTKDGHGSRFERLRQLEAAHPVPDARGEAAARSALELVAAASPRDVLLVLLSGGASALLSCPLEGLRREDLAETTEQLLACGADIDAVNQVRKHIMAIGGGRLARAASCSRIEVLAVSDVPGDRLEVIGSGPCETDTSTFADALAVLRDHDILGAVPERVVAHLERGVRGRVAESAKPGEPGLPEVHSTIVARSFDAANAAAAAAAELGIRGVWLGPVLRGEARDRGRELARMGLTLEPSGPTCLIASGETTVTLRAPRSVVANQALGVTSPGLGGRNQELALAAALELAGQGRVCLLAAGTDGTDGPTDAAGAFVDGGTVSRGRNAGREAAMDLDRNDSNRFFSLEGGLLHTGPTGTNVMDLALVGVGLDSQGLAE